MIFAGLALAASPAVAQDTSSTNPPPPPAPEKKICKTIVPTGSMMGKRFCLTKAEWRQFDEINERATDIMTGQMNKITRPKGP